MRNERWQRALDVQMDFWKWCDSAPGRTYNYCFFLEVLNKLGFEDETNVGPPSAQLARHLISTLWQADTMYVTSDMLHLLMQAAQDLPEEATFDEKTLITPNGFCLFEEPIVGSYSNGETILFHGMTWKVDVVNVSNDPTKMGKQDRCIVIYFLVDPTDDRDAYNQKFVSSLREFSVTTPPLTLQHFYPATVGSTIARGSSPDIKTVADTLRLFIAMHLLGQQKIGEPMQMRPDRATRKRMARTYGINERLITLITLRRKSVKKDDHEPAKVEWSRRWAVQGHWRNQYYPKTDTHSYVYIHEYIKGPEDKPFIPSERRIFNFRR